MAIKNINKPRRLFSLKMSLIKVNKKIDFLCDNITESWDDSNLTEFERFVIVIEDRRFFSHTGVDLKSIIRELQRAVFKLRRPFGASTIDMQFIRTVTNHRDRTIRRKISEGFYAWILNFHASKKAILRSYLDVAYFGTNLTGADDASFKLFDCSSDQLEGYDAAFLAATLVSPIPKNRNKIWKKKVAQRAERAILNYPSMEKVFYEVANTKIG